MPTLSVCLMVYSHRRRAEDAEDLYYVDFRSIHRGMFFFLNKRFRRGLLFKKKRQEIAFGAKVLIIYWSSAVNNIIRSDAMMQTQAR
jgi:hypothetical protein